MADSKQACWWREKCNQSDSRDIAGSSARKLYGSLGGVTCTGASPWCTRNWAHYWSVTFSRFDSSLTASLSGIAQ